MIAYRKPRCAQRYIALLYHKYLDVRDCVRTFLFVNFRDLSKIKSATRVRPAGFCCWIHCRNLSNDNGLILSRSSGNPYTLRSEILLSNPDIPGNSSGVTSGDLLTDTD